MIKDGMIDRLEDAGFRVDCAPHAVSIYSNSGKLIGEVFVNHPRESWLGGAIIDWLWNFSPDDKEALLDFIAYKQNPGYMPNLFILETSKGFIKRGNSIEFTQTSPTLFTAKQLNEMRLRVAALNPVTYKVN